MKTNKNLRAEGDINLGPKRKAWNDSRQESVREILAEDERYFISQSLSTPCLDVIEETKESSLFNIEGHEYLDFHGNNLHQVGYGNPKVIEKIKEQLDKLPFCPRRYTNTTAIDCAKKLVGIAPGNLNKTLFAPGGTSVNGIALKLARLATGKFKTISMWDSFHGASLDMVSLGGERIFRNNAGPLLTGTSHVPPCTSYRGMFENDKDADLKYAEFIEYVIDKEGDVAAVFAETIRNTDVQVPTKRYWQEVRRICDKNNILLILDEIPICFGRTGKMFAFEHFGIIPDIVTVGKILGGGIIPFAAMICRDDIDIPLEQSIGHYTHEKSPVGAAAAIAVMQYFEDMNLLDKVHDDEIFMKNRLNDMMEKYDIIGDIRGLGMLWAVELVKDRITKERAIDEAESIMYNCLENGLSFKVSAGNVINLSPPLTISKQELEKALNILENAIKPF